jgi:DNA invertase Pin-like site-specific DNA recombinase
VQACERKAAELGCDVARAYVERAESARSDDRPVLQRMLRELPDLSVRYLVVHKVDRLARHRLDDAVLYQRPRHRDQEGAASEASARRHPIPTAGRVSADARPDESRRAHYCR